MKPEPDKNLERLIDERLRALPELRAPESLVPNVLQRIAARKEKVWWRRAWPEWPRGMQVLSLVLLAGMLGAAWYYGGSVTVSTDGLTNHVGGALSFLRPVWSLLTALAGAIQVVFNSIKTEYIIIAGAVIAFLYVTAVGLGSLCYRLAADKNHSF